MATDNITAKIERFVHNTELMDQIVNGADTDDVQTDGGKVPTIAKVMKGLGEQNVGAQQGFLDGLEAALNTRADVILAALDTRVNQDADGVLAGANAAAASAASGVDAVQTSASAAAASAAAAASSDGDASASADAAAAARDVAQQWSIQLNTPVNGGLYSARYYAQAAAASASSIANGPVVSVNGMAGVVTIDKTTVGLPNVANLAPPDLPISILAQAALDLKADLVAGKVPASQLPSYVDDVLEFATIANFPTPGEAGKIYIAVNGAIPANPTRQYRWTGSIYAEINVSPGTTDALVEGPTNLYFTTSRVLAAVASGAPSYQIGANVTASKNFTLTTGGDGTMKLARGKPGATTQDIMTIDAAGNIKQPNMPMFSVFLSANQAKSVDSYDKCIFNSKTIDVTNAYDTTTGRFQPAVAGYYQLNAMVSLEPTGAPNNFQVNLYKNGVSCKRLSVLTASASSGLGIVAIGGSALVYLNGTTDNVEVWAYLGSGVSSVLSSDAAGSLTHFSGFLVRPD